MRSAQVAPRPPGRCDVKYRILPSSEKRGLLLSNAGAVYRAGSPPCVGTTHTSEWRLFSASRTVVTVKATLPPSGESAGVLTVVILYQSAGVNARLAGVDC
jgi:hypothetical protein